MAADTSVVKPVEAPPLAPLTLKTKLAPTPKSAPKYSVKVKNSAGADVTLADPRATRALVALMDVHAVVGGAACHWGGPAAFAEMNAAIHGIMFATQGHQWHEEWRLCLALSLRFRRHDVRHVERLPQYRQQTHRPR